MCGGSGAVAKERCYCGDRATIAVASVGFRALFFPFAIKSQVNNARLMALRPEMQSLQQTMSSGMASPEALQAQQRLAALLKQHDCHPFRSFKYALLQVPVYITFFLTLREMAERIPSFATEGALWFPNLSIPDPTYSLPALCGLTFLTTLESAQQVPGAQRSSAMKWFFRAFALAMIPITAQFPAVK